MQKVLILCGASGSGKSTLANTLLASAHVDTGRLSADNFYQARMATKRVSADDFFMVDGEYRFDASQLGEAHGWCLRDYTSVLTNFENYELVIIDNTNTSVAEVAPYAALALAYGWQLEIHILHCDLETCLERNVHGVPAAEISKQLERLATLRGLLPPWWPVTESSASLRQPGLLRRAFWGLPMEAFDRREETMFYWTVDGVPACQSEHTVGVEFDPPNYCASDRREALEELVERFHRLRPGHEVRILAGHCPRPDWREEP